ncbi:MAG: radical SAM protein [Candidatus Margulisbacteria bacterium]|nr:radical SAM protein [Candidatus Margulisiibacteriota bacterium]
MKINLSELKFRVEQLQKRLIACDICPHFCRVNRLKNKKGFCQAGRELEIAHIGLHFGEEPPLSGLNGSGAIFFYHCNLRCVYCQNWQISQNSSQLSVVSGQLLAKQMLALQEQGAHNINFVSPTHYVPYILEGLIFALEKGLKIPLIYNTNAYDSMEVLKLLDGVIDIYLPDIKYCDNKIAKKYSGIENYVEHSRAAIKKMFKQVGWLDIDRQGVAKKGVIVRHLVMPNNLAGSKECLKFLASISKEISISLMAQYSPQHKSSQAQELNRKITISEYEEIVDYAHELGLENCWIQDLDSSDTYLPDFASNKPFS